MKTDLAETIGTRIRAKREKESLTQKALADKVGVSPAAINQFEKGIKKPSSDVLTRIAKELESSTDYLLGLSGEEDLFVSEEVAAAFRDYKKLSKQDKDVIRKNIEFLKDKARKEKGKK